MKGGTTVPETRQLAMLNAKADIFEDTEGVDPKIRKCIYETVFFTHVVFAHPIQLFGQLVVNLG